MDDLDRRISSTSAATTTATTRVSARPAILCAGILATLIAPPIVASPSQAVEPKYWRGGQTIAAIPHAAWEAGGQVTVVTGEPAKAAPANAVKYTVKAVKWPNATVKVLEFTKAGGGVLYPLTDETHFVVVKGALQADVNGTPITIGSQGGRSGTQRYVAQCRRA